MSCSAPCQTWHSSLPPHWNSFKCAFHTVKFKASPLMFNTSKVQFFFPQVWVLLTKAKTSVQGWEEATLYTIHEKFWYPHLCTFYTFFFNWVTYNCLNFFFFSIYDAILNFKHILTLCSVAHLSALQRAKNCVSNLFYPTITIRSCTTDSVGSHLWLTWY